MQQPGQKTKHLVMRIPEERRLTRIKRDVHEIVEIGENGNFGELADAGNEGKALLPFKRLDDGIERLECVAERTDARRIQVFQKRLVVLVYEQHDLTIRRRGGEVVDEVAERNRRQFAPTQGNAIAARLVFKEIREQTVELFGAIGLHASEIEPQNRPPLRPIPERLDEEPLEKLALPFEKRLENRDRQRLAESPRPGNEKLRTNRQIYERPKPIGLVDIRKAVLYEFLERINISRELFHEGNDTTPRHAGANNAAGETFPFCASDRRVCKARTDDSVLMERDAQ